MLGPVHTSNIVEATFDFVEETFDFVATNGNNIERFYCKISSFRQCRMLLRHCCQKRQQCRSNIRHCGKNRSTCSVRQRCFDIVASMDGALYGSWVDVLLGISWRPSYEKQPRGSKRASDNGSSVTNRRRRVDGRTRRRSPGSNCSLPRSRRTSRARDAHARPPPSPWSRCEPSWPPRRDR